MRFLTFLAVFVFFGCTTTVSEGDLQNLNGYWEIEKVTFPNGQTKDFKVSTTVDYIELKGLEGFRKKMQPKFDGTFETSNDAEYFVIESKSEGFEIHYNPNMALHPDMHHRESLTQLSKDKFSVVSKDTLTYTYKRFQPINATE